LGGAVALRRPRAHRDGLQRARRRPRDDPQRDRRRAGSARGDRRTPGHAPPADRVRRARSRVGPEPRRDLRPAPRPGAPHAGCLPGRRRRRPRGAAMPARLVATIALAALATGCGPELDVGSDLLLTARFETGTLDEFTGAPGGSVDMFPASAAV